MLIRGFVSTLRILATHMRFIRDSGGHGISKIGTGLERTFPTPKQRKILQHFPSPRFSIECLHAFDLYPTLAFSKSDQGQDLMAILIYQNLPEVSREFWSARREHVAEKTGDFRSSTFCEFGASDGYTFSNTFMLEKVFGWTGLLIEPNRTFHRELSRNRSSKLSYDVVGGKEIDVVFEGDTENPFLSSVRTSESCCEELAPIKSPLSGKTQEVLRSKPLEKILTEFDMENIFFLSMDVEGMELEILRSGFLDNWIFAFVTVETNGRNDESDIFSIMEEAGYIRLSGVSYITGGDAWFVHNKIMKHLPETLVQ